MSSRRGNRPHAADLWDDAATTCVKSHIKVGDLNLTRLFVYEKRRPRVRKGQAGKGLMRHRHALFDMVVFARGKLVKFRKFEAHMFVYLQDKVPGTFTNETVSVVVSRVRRMMSHL